MSREQEILGFDLLMGEGTLVAGSLPTDLKYTGNVRSIIDTTRVATTPPTGISPTRIIAPSAGAEFETQGRVILLLLRVGSLSHWLAIGEGLAPEVCEP
jgi:hypothetical protein